MSSEAWAQTTPQAVQNDTQTETAPAPGDPNAPQAPVAPGPDTSTNDTGQGAIVVTGIRGGIRSSVNIKRKEQSIVEAVSAEDIGKLPDISIAESIARLPGLAAQRVNGRSQYISIRGLAPDFTTTLLNGRQQASSGDNRAVEFDQYPSELLSSVVIYKTPDANVSGMGLSGTADLRTVRPLSFGKRAIALNLRGEALGQHKLNADMGTKGWRGSASYIGQLTPQFGVAVGLAYLDSPSQNEHFKAYGHETFCCGQETRIEPADARDATYLTGQELFAYSRRNKRLAGIAIAEWQPSDRLHSIVDLYYSRFKQKEVMRGAQWFSNVWADNQTFTNVVTEDRDGTKLAISGVDNGVTPQLRNDYNTRVDHLFSAGWNAEYKFTDQLAMIADLSYSRNKRDESITELYAGSGCCGTGDPYAPATNRDSISWDFGGSGFPEYSEGLNYADASQVSLGDHNPWSWGHDGATKEPHVKETVKAADGGFRYEPTNFGPIRTIDLGVNFTSRHKTKFVDEWFDDLKGAGRPEVLIDSSDLIDPTSLDYAGFGDVIAFNVPDALAKYYDFVPTLDTGHYDKSWGIKENVTTWRARAMFESGALHGNLGVQVIHTKQSSSGLRIDPTASPIIVSAVKEGDSFTDVLPMLNSYVDLGGGHRIRFAAAKEMARPRMDEMRANLVPGFANPCGGSPPCVPGQEVHPWSAEGGNPRLKPWRAKAVDLSYEWYIGPASYISIAGFYKKLDTYIFSQTLPYDFSGTPLPSDAPAIPPGVIVSPIGQITQPANGRGGKIYGFELSGALELGRLTKMLDGFGVIGSLSKTKSNLKFKNPGDDPTAAPTARIPGLSGTVYNITGYFEKWGFQARMSYRYRSKFKGDVVQLFANRGYSEILADKQVDAQIGYTFPDGSRFHDLGVLLQVYNLTDSPYRTRNGLDTGGNFTANGGTYIETYEKYGPQYLFGVNYKF